MSYFSICVILGLSALATIGLVILRHEIAALWERWLSLGRPAQCVTILSLTIAVLYGGTKAPSSTNEPPDDASSSTNAPMCCALGVGERGGGGVGGVVVGGSS